MTVTLMVWLYFVLFLVLMMASIPIPFAMMATTLLYCLQVDFNLIMFAQRTAVAFSDYTLLAVPTFIFVGVFMNETDFTDRIFDFCQKFLGHIPGGLAHANVFASMVFAGMSGSVQADAGGLGVIEIKAMTKAGYDRDYSCAITAASSVIGPIIPPSINLVVYGYLAQVSTLSLFLGGLMPGIMMGLSLMVLICIQAKRGKSISVEVLPRTPFREVMKSLWSTLPALGGPVLLIGGIMSGIFTPTECGCIAGLYILILALLQKKLDLKIITTSLKKTLSTTAMTMFLISTGAIFNWMIITGGVLDDLTGVLLTIGNKYILLFLLNLIMLIMGCFMGNMSILVMMTPLLVVLAGHMDIDLVHMGVIAVLNLTIGCLTPPMAPALFTACKVSNSNFGRALKYTMLFVIPFVVTLLIVTYVPAVTMWLPTVMK